MGFFDAIGNILATNSSNAANERNVSTANDANLQIARERNASEIALWREQSAYNSPQAQMTRLQAAGLNPNLVYGQIAESKASAPPSLETAHMDAPTNNPVRFNDVNPVAEYQQIVNMDAMNSKVRADAEAAKANAVRSVADAKYSAYQTDALMSSGTLKSDPTPVKVIGRVGAAVKDGIQRGTRTYMDTMKKLGDQYKPVDKLKGLWNHLLGR